MRVTPAEKISFFPSERRNCRPRPKISTPEWAEMYREVTVGPARGRYRIDFTAYVRKPMEVMDQPWVRKVFLNWAPQTGKTATAFNYFLKVIDTAPGPAMYVMSSEKTTRRIVRRQIIPTLKQTPRIARLLSSKADDLSLEQIRFNNGMDLMLGWATSPAIMASESVQYIFYDEPGKYDLFSGKEADVFTLGDVRTNWYPYTSKQIFFSTPNLYGDPWYRVLTDEPDERWHYEAKCPFCGTLQEMKFKQIVWGGYKDAGTVVRKNSGRYQCIDCMWEWDDFDRNKAVRDGHWACDHQKEKPVAVAFDPLPAWYSPVVSLSKCASVYLKTRNDPAKRQGFITQYKCQHFRETIKDVNESAVLQLRDLSVPPHVVPAGFVALTAGIDMQKRGFWYVVVAWTPELDSHLVDYGTLDEFRDVETLLFSGRYRVARSDRSLPIWRAALDTGGGETVDGDWTRTEEAYMWLRRHEGKRLVYGTKGASNPQLSRIRVSVIDKMAPRSPGGMPRRIQGGLKLRIIDTAQFKDLLHYRMERREGESQRFTLHADTGLDFARQILAEEKRRDRRGRTRYVQVRTDNHLLDCMVLASACADNQWTPSLAVIAARKGAGGLDNARVRGEGSAGVEGQPPYPAQTETRPVYGQARPAAARPAVPMIDLAAGGSAPLAGGVTKPGWFRNRIIR